MEKKQVEKIFTKDSENFDSKHKINLSKKQIPQDVIDRLNDGLNIEDIDALTAKGYPICKYRTQITVHGICKRLSGNSVVGNYVSLTINKNKSLGVRWNAVDSQKRMQIEEVVSHFGWNRITDSQYDYFSIIREYTEDNLNELKSIMNRIDNSLFFGNCKIISFLAFFSRPFIELILEPLGIYQKNVNTLIEQMTGVSISEANKKVAEDKAQRAAEMAKLDAEYEARRIEARRKMDEWKRNNPMPEGFVKSNTLNVGDITCHLKEGYDSCEWVFNVVYKAGGFLCEKRCDINGNTKQYERGSRVWGNEWFVKRT